MVVRNEILLGNTVEKGALPACPHPAVTLPGEHKGGRAVLSFGRDVLCTHLLLLGATGSGKTNALLYMIEQLKGSMTADDVMLVFDSKMDFGRFQGRQDCVISNFSNANAVGWNIFMDLTADGWEREEIALNADEMADLIFSEVLEQAKEPFFPKAARNIFAAVLKAITFLGIDSTEHRIRYMNNQALRQYLNGLTPQKLQELLKPFPELIGELKYVGDGSTEQALGVMAELQAVTGSLFSGCFGKNGRFSVRRMERERGGRTLFVEYDAARGASFRPIYRILVDLFLKEALSPRQKKGRVYIICDELKLLPHLKHFEDGLNFGRSLGVSVIAGIQSMEQLYEVYGECGGRNIASAFQSTFCFYTTNQASRQYIRGIHGQNLQTLQYLDSMKKTVENIREGWAAEDWHFNTLRVGEAIVGLPHCAPFVFRIERYR